MARREPEHSTQPDGTPNRIVEVCRKRGSALIESTLSMWESQGDLSPLKVIAADIRKASGLGILQAEIINRPDEPFAQFAFIDNKASAQDPTEPLLVTRILFNNPVAFLETTKTADQFGNLTPEQQDAVQLSLVVAHTYLTNRQAFTARVKDIYAKAGELLNITPARVEAAIPKDVLEADFGLSDLQQAIGCYPEDPHFDRYVGQLIYRANGNPDFFIALRARYYADLHDVLVIEDNVDLAAKSPDARAKTVISKLITFVVEDGLVK